LTILITCTKTKFLPGDVLIVEEPVTAVVDTDKRNVVCSKCFKISYTLIPCKHCHQVNVQIFKLEPNLTLFLQCMYCDEKCLEEAWASGHDKECFLMTGTLANAVILRDHQLFFGYNNKKKFTMSCLAMALMSKVVGYAQMKKLVTENAHLSSSFRDACIKGFDKDCRFTFSLEALLSLTDNYNKLTGKEKASLITYAVTTVMKIPEWADDIITISALFIKLFLICVFNYKPVAVLTNISKEKIDEIFGDKNNQATSYVSGETGFALYLASSLLNFSCEPNLVKACYGSTVVYRAIVPIRKGEQLTEAPYIIRLNENLAQRRKLLMETYRFSCKCLPCLENWPTLVDMKEEDSTVVSDSLMKILKKREFHEVFSSGDYIRMLNYAYNLFPVDKKLLATVKNILSSFYKEPNWKNEKFCQFIKLSLSLHYIALGGAIFSKTGKELFTGSNSNLLSSCNVLDELHEFREKYYADSVA
jgi:hypothetical protein